jgi:deoxyribodipyrimidine photolyase-related protein
MVKNLAVILGDQLSLEISSLRKIYKEDHILMMEVMNEASYVPHHKHKIILIFAAMRHFAKKLQDLGYNVTYTKFTDEYNTHTIAGEISRFIEKNNIAEIFITEVGEYRLFKELDSLKEIVPIKLTFVNDDRFIVDREFFKNWAKDRKELILEYFYREIRRKTNILMDGKKPCGDKWNYDAENRKPAGSKIPKIKSLEFKDDAITRDVKNLVAENFPDNMGDIQDFNYAVTREDALKAFEFFIEEKLPNFGAYQDVMYEDQAFLFHSLISPYLNIGFLNPLEICQRIEEQYRKNLAPLNAVEGFIRQVIGWREFIRGVYWHYMPEYTKSNFLEAKNKLPEFYWTGKTELNCLKQVIAFTKKYAYSHHIQRLMITGNFALLIGADIKQVHEWYLAVYIDAFEWVESPNVIGMSLYADGGIVATKPYISGGSYIKRMSNFCKNCKYDVKTNDQENSCPFNYLYWNFLDMHKNKFRYNRRMAIAYNNLDKMDKRKLDKIKNLATNFIKVACYVS